MVEGVLLHRRANDVLAELETSALSDDELEAAIVGLHRENERGVAMEAQLASTYDARRAYRSDGSKSAAARLARETKAPVGQMRAQVGLGRRLRLMPKVETALTGGEISVEHARILGRLAASERDAVAEAFPDAEELLLGYAKTLEFGDFVKAIRYWEQVVDANGAEDTAEDQHARRRLHLSETMDGIWVGDMLFDAIGGAIVDKALAAIYRELFEADWAEAKASHGDDTRLEHLKRTAAQRRADAMVEMARRAMAKPKDARLPAPLFTIHIGYETFAGRLCELASGTVVTPGQLLPWLSQASIERAVFDGPNRIIELGQRTRFFTGGLRRAIEIRDRFCAGPGCTTPAEQCEIDHIQPYEQGGLTTQANGIPRCRSDHRHKTKTQDANPRDTRDPP